MPSPTPEELATLLSARLVIVWPITSLSITYFVYGFYVLLFGTCVYMMRGHQHGNERLDWNLYLSLTVALFVFSTAFVVVYTTDMIYVSITLFTALKTQEYEPLVDLIAHSIEQTIAPFFEGLLSVLLNITAECMLVCATIHHAASIKLISSADPPLLSDLGFKEKDCHTPDSSFSSYEWYMLATFPQPPTSTLTIYPILVLGLIGTALYTFGLSDRTIHSKLTLYDIGKTITAAYETASPAINSILTLLTAGRILWIHRQVRVHNVHTTSDKLIRSVSRIIVESGSLYPIFSIVALITANTATIDAIPFDFSPLVILSAGISPTLIMVRAKLGKNVESLQDQISGIRFTSRPAPREGTTTVSQAQVYPLGNLNMAAVELEGGSERQMINGKESVA
ncbi:hypothetical protein WG66_004492 [Moniliophthora roreri]|uniref:Uncharacterized protein n=1 Tax=Moniliophthora roreri TaxID=221103 RepID=A0A0W0G621_MONRR|nr:hypothetical protein WG66_004492 [Moniliophthora roreri]